MQPNVTRQSPGAYGHRQNLSALIMSDNRLNPKEFNNNYLKGTKIDIFDDFDSEVHPVKYFMHLYDELCFTYKITTDLNIPDFLEKLREHKKLKDNQFILKDEMGKDKKPREVDYEYAYYLILMREKMLLEVNQHFPFAFEGPADDPKVYAAIERLTGAQTQ